MAKNYQLFEALCNLLPKVLPRIQPALKEKYFPSEIKNYPNLSYNEKGFPAISSYPLKLDAGNLFRDGWQDRKPTINLKEFDEFNSVFQIAINTSDIVEYLIPNLPDFEDKQFILERRCEHFIEQFIERYYYVNGPDFNVGKFNLIYQPVENFIYSDKLYFDISVPILFVQFETDQYQLAPSIQIRRIDDQVQRARHKIVGYSPAVVDSVYMSATHELVFKDFWCERPKNWLISPFGQANFYRELSTEKFFTILKIVTDVSSGYAQFLIHPKNWVDFYDADLPHLTGAATKNYPTFFDDYYWNQSQFPKITQLQVEEIAEVYGLAVNSTQNKLEFALKRFYKSIMRESEEDVIIDLIIALEMLLSDSEKGEITHKLSLRLATLLSRYGKGFDPLKVFALMKKIYGYRSSVVHGSHDINKKREIKLEENMVIPLVNLAKDYLREILKIIIREPQYLRSSEIDNLLLIKNGL
jgi:hypothetical protein